MAERKWPKFSSSAITDKIEFWLVMMVTFTWQVMDDAWRHNVANEWAWFAAVSLVGIRLVLLKNELARSVNIRLTGDTEKDNAALQRLSDLLKEK